MLLPTQDMALRERIDQWLEERSIRPRVIGFGGAIISLFTSKPVAKWSTGAQVIHGSEGATQAWLVETVRRLAQRAEIGMPDVAI